MLKMAKTITFYDRYCRKINMTSSMIIVWLQTWLIVWSFLKFHFSCLMTKPTKWYVRPAKTGISLGVCQIWSVFTVHSMGSWGPTVSSGGQQRLIRLGGCPDWSVFAGHTYHFDFVMRRLICSAYRMHAQACKSLYLLYNTKKCKW